MRQLHFVGVADDRQGLIVAAGDGPGEVHYLVAVDRELLTALEDLRRAHPAARPHLHAVPDRDDPAGAGAPVRTREGRRPTFPGSRPSVGSLTPREMQARLRAGHSVDEVAREAGVDPSWVERFASPIVAERYSVVHRAGTMTLQSARRGPSARPLAESVRRNLLEKGLRLADDTLASGWSAFQHDGPEWVVRFSYAYRGRDIQADWLVDLRGGSLAAANRPASTLGFLATPSATGDDGADDLGPSEADRRADAAAGAVTPRSRRARRGAPSDLLLRPADPADERPPVAEVEASGAAPARRPPGIDAGPLRSRQSSAEAGAVTASEPPPPLF